eukprot:GHVP01053050.1.p1 GENE.GHVP01053050.1~~GHVP01053050.1.p1  ORF type:complete len:905 (+),score=133.69 GHVP01053050.1:20-2734(+)
MNPLDPLSPMPRCGVGDCSRPCDVWIENAAYEACDGVQMTLDKGWPTTSFRNSDFFSLKNWFHLEYVDDDTTLSDLSGNEIFDMSLNSTSQYTILFFTFFIWLVVIICFCCGTCKRGCTRSCCEVRPRVKPFQLIKYSRLSTGFWIAVIVLPIMTALCCLAAWLNDSINLSVQQYECAMLGSANLLTNGTTDVVEPWGGLVELTAETRNLYQFYYPTNGTIADVSRNSTDEFVDPVVGEIETILVEGEALIPNSMTPTQSNFISPSEVDGVLLLHKCVVCDAIDRWVTWENAEGNLKTAIENLRELQDEIYTNTGEDSDLDEISEVLEKVYYTLNDPNGLIKKIYGLSEYFETATYYTNPVYITALMVIILIFPFLAVIGGWLLFGGTMHHYKKPSEPNPKHAATAFCCLWCFFALAGAAALLFMTLGFFIGQMSSYFCEPLDASFNTGELLKIPGVDFSDLVNMTGVSEQCLWKEGNGNIVAAELGGQSEWDAMVESNDNATISFQNTIEETRIALEFENFYLLEELKYNTWVYFPDWKEALETLPNSVFAYKQAIYGGVFQIGYGFPQFIKDEFADEIGDQLDSVNEYRMENLERLGLNTEIGLAEQISTIDEWDQLYGFESISDRLNEAANDAATICQNPVWDIKTSWCACGYQSAGTPVCDVDVQFDSVVDLDVLWPVEDLILFPEADEIYQCFMEEWRITQDNSYYTHALYFSSTLFWVIQKCQINSQRNDNSDLFIINGTAGTLEEFSPYSEIDSDPSEWGFSRTKIETMIISYQDILPALDIYEDSMMQILPNLTSTIQERIIDEYHCRSLYHMMDASLGYICYQFTGNAMYLAIVYSLLVVCCLLGWIVAWKWYHYWRDRNSPANDLPDNGFYLGGGLVEGKDMELNQSFDSEMFT